LLIFIGVQGLSSRENFVLKPWVDPVPAPVNPLDPTEPERPGPVPPFPPLPYPVPVDFEVRKIMAMVEELRQEVESLKLRVVRLELLGKEAMGSKPPRLDRCEEGLFSLKNASKLLALEQGIKMDFSGKKTAFQILVSEGYLSKIPHFFARVRSRKDGSLRCLPLED
jgi:hypothetical protein